jgi:hypothetical protein
LLKTVGFTHWVGEQPADWDADYAALQLRLTENPELGKVIKGSGGLRKIRLPDPKRGKGKRGGARVIYLHVPEANCVCMIDACGKDEKEDLSPADRQVLAQLAEVAKRKVIRTTGHHPPDEGMG